MVWDEEWHELWGATGLQVLFFASWQRLICCSQRGSMGKACAIPRQKLLEEVGLIAFMAQIQRKVHYLTPGRDHVGQKCFNC